MVSARSAVEALAAALSLVSLAHGHGMLVHPVPRNARDASLPQFLNGSFAAGRTDGCDCANPAGGCKSASRASGQACLWFSQGCSIGCASCTGGNGHSAVRLCNATLQPSNNDPASRTMNRFAVTGSANDTFRFNPWRAPGAAPVDDACGRAGGAKYAGGGAAVFAAVPWAKQGDLGSAVLKKGPPSATYKAGSVVEMSWGPSTPVLPFESHKGTPNLPF